MAITPADVIAVAPELATQSNERIQLFIGYATPYVNANVWGEKTNYALSLFTAHLMTLTGRQGAGGSISSETVGGLSRSYSNPSSTDAMASTGYGQTFAMLMKSLPTSPRVINGSIGCGPIVLSGWGWR